MAPSAVALPIQLLGNGSNHTGILLILEKKTILKYGSNHTGILFILEKKTILRYFAHKMNLRLTLIRKRPSTTAFRLKKIHYRARPNLNDSGNSRRSSRARNASCHGGIRVMQPQICFDRLRNGSVFPPNRRLTISRRC